MVNPEPPTVSNHAYATDSSNTVIPTSSNASVQPATSTQASSSTFSSTDHSISLLMDTSNPSDEEATSVKADEVAYRLYKFQVEYSATSEYALYVNSMNGYDGNLYGKQNPTAKITGVGSHVNPRDFGNNTWGYAIADGDSDGTNLSYDSIPSHDATMLAAKEVTIKPDSAITDEAMKRNYTLSFAAKIGSDSPADHYQTKVYLSVVRTPGRFYSVTYNANGGNTTTLPTEQTTVDKTNAPSIPLTLSNSIPTRSGYVFKGWATSQADADSLLPTYQAGENITLLADNSRITLYAVWKEEDAYTITYNANGGSNPPTTQTYTDTQDIGSHTFTIPTTVPTLTQYRFIGWATSQANANAGTVAYAAGASVTLTSANPSLTLYAVWEESSFGIQTMQAMTTAICKAADVGTTDILEDTRDHKTYWVTKLRDGNCWMTQNLDYDTAYGTRIDNLSSWTKSVTSARYYDPGLKIISGTELVDAPSDVDTHLLVGNYYNFAAAVNANSSISQGDVNSSICPTGWKLPSAGDTTNTAISYKNLLSDYISTGEELNGAPYYYQYTGIIDDTVLSYVGANARYMSSTVYGSTGVYVLYFTPTTINVSEATNGHSQNNRRSGFPVRCLFPGK